MQKPPLDPDVADTAPSDSVLTVYDEQHIITYLRLLDANAEGADWREVARIVLHLDPEREPDRAWRAFESHLSPNGWRSTVTCNCYVLARPLKAICRQGGCAQDLAGGSPPGVRIRCVLIVVRRAASLRLVEVGSPLQSSRGI
jgi:hypothetical protein